MIEFIAYFSYVQLHTFDKCRSLFQLLAGAAVGNSLSNAAFDSELTYLNFFSLVAVCAKLPLAV